MNVLATATPRNNALSNNGTADTATTGAPAQTHRVTAGETLGSVAAAHNLSLDALWGANPHISNMDRLKAGTELRIPSAEEAPRLAAEAERLQSGPLPQAETRAPTDPEARRGAAAARGTQTEGIRQGLTERLPTLQRGSRGADVRGLQDQLRAAGFDPGPSDGRFGPLTERAVRGFQASRGLEEDGKAGSITRGALRSGRPATPGTDTAQAPGTQQPGTQRPGTQTPGTQQPGTATPPSGTTPADNTANRPGSVGQNGVVRAGVPFTPNQTALDAANRSAAGRSVARNFEANRAVYEEASRRTGVPASMIAALHANESSMGTNRNSTRGPESGFGLDDRFVSTAWGNQQLARHGLGRWERGTGTPNSTLQSAVIAAEHLKRQARTAGVEIGPNMTANQMAAAANSYVAGGASGRRALEAGRGFMFDRADNNPHVMHPGGTSRGPGGTTIRVPPSRKEGLLRWDVLIPMMEQRLAR